MMTEEEREMVHASWADYYKDMLRFQANKALSKVESRATELEELPTAGVELKTEKENHPTGLNKSPFEELSAKIEELEKQTEALKKQIDALSTTFDTVFVHLRAKIARLDSKQAYYGWGPRQTGNAHKTTEWCKNPTEGVCIDTEALKRGAESLKPDTEGY